MSWFGEPTVKVKSYLEEKDLFTDCQKTDMECDYDEILLSGLKAQILASTKDKIFVVLHTSTSHGPTYYKKYPPKFNQFMPVCKSVELAKCTQKELINAYDNTILYTDYILATLIDELKELDGYSSTMFYVSDHGESLGEKNLYMHGIPMSIAPKEQIEIPFIVWASDDSVVFKENKMLSQYYVFHSVLDFLDIESPVYDKDKSIFK